MRIVSASSLVLLMMAFVAVVQAEDIKSGPQVGDAVGTYRTTKCNESGPGRTDKTFCYT